jgi:hypothetical protein
MRLLPFYRDWTGFTLTDITAFKSLPANVASSTLNELPDTSTPPFMMAPAELIFMPRTTSEMRSTKRELYVTVCGTSASSSVWTPTLRLVARGFAHDGSADAGFLQKRIEALPEAHRVVVGSQQEQHHTGQV